MEQKKEVTTYLWERLKERKYYFLIAVCLIILYQLGLGVFVSIDYINWISGSRDFFITI